MTVCDQKKTILLVEDDDLVRKLVNQMLTRQGHAVIEAQDPEAALSLFDGGALKPDLCITDIVMPKMNGRELAVKLLEVQPDLPILYMSGYSPKALKGNLDSSNIHLLPKPFSMEELALTVKNILS